MFAFKISWFYDQNIKLFEKFEVDENCFCRVDDEDGESEVYVDLIENPERFTDYSGPSSTQIWSAIYNENCFISEENSGMFKHECKDCQDRKLFYRLVSGNNRVEQSRVYK